MRVLVATDALAGLSPTEASQTIARAFAARGAQAAVVPLGIDGAHLATAVSTAAPAAEFIAAHTSTEVGAALAGAAPNQRADAGAEPAGDVVPERAAGVVPERAAGVVPERAASLRAPDEGPTEFVLDLTDITVEDLGREALLHFGEEPTTALAAARQAWAGRDLVALVPQGTHDRPLTGLEGHASTELRAAGATLQEILTFDAAAERWAAELGLDPTPGAGAAGGLGLLIQALGGRVTDPLTWLGERFGLERTLQQADLVVTGAELLDFHARGGPVVHQVVAWAEAALRPVIAITGRNFVSSRELRLAGLESAHALRVGPGDEPATPDELAEAAARVATSWNW